MDNTNQQQLKSGNNNTLQFNLGGDEINEELRKRVIATLHANITKSSPNADTRVCFVRAKSIEDALYKSVSNKVEYQNRLIAKLIELNPHQQQQNLRMNQQQLTQMTPQQYQHFATAIQQKRMYLAQQRANIATASPQIPQISPQQQQIPLQQHNMQNMQTMLRYKIVIDNILKSGNQRINAQEAEVLKLFGFTAETQLTPDVRAKLTQLSNRLAHQATMHVNQLRAARPLLNGTPVNPGGATATAASNLINPNQAAQIAAGQLPINSLQGRPAVSGINPTLRPNLLQAGIRPSIQNLNLQAMQAAGYQIPTTATTSAAEGFINNLEQLTSASMGQTAALVNPAISNTTPPTMKKQPTNQTSITPYLISNNPPTNTVTNITSAPAAAAPQQQAPSQSSIIQKVLSDSEIAEAKANIKKIDEERQRDNQISYSENHEVSEQEKRTILEKLESLKPMYEKIDEYLPYVWHFYKNQQTIVRILGMKKMIGDLQEAISEGKLNMKLHTLEKLHTEFKRYFEVAEKSHRGETMSDPFAIPRASPPPNVKDVFSSTQKPFTLNQPPTPKHANNKTPNPRSNSKSIPGKSTNRTGKDNSSTNKTSTATSNIPNQNVDLTGVTAKRHRKSSLDVEKPASVPAQSSVHNTNKTSELIDADISDGNFSSSKRRRIDAGEKSTQLIQENFTAPVTPPAIITASNGNNFPIGLSSQAMNTSPMFNHSMVSRPIEVVDDDGDDSDAEDKRPPVESLFDRQVSREKQSQSFQLLEDVLLNFNPGKKMIGGKEISESKKSINPMRLILDGPDPVPESSENKLLVFSMRGAC
ncbi:1987_t:CDS:2 [Ambispora gerdemannii]|uniref:1987_t:CDS:1 n=1 Tax=Ambispora gerdemannii TaxID=144530 RepID=A0A9N8UZV2_9GLOM|nr:1987_t:CDS:2 [Ambispora gerdemannii]